LSLKACTHLCNQSPGLSQNLVPGLEISSPPDLFEISRLQIEKNRPYKQRRKVKSHFPPYQTLTLEPLNLPC
ncbi:unnamed protein product, partial [Staurois parvus]